MLQGLDSAAATPADYGRALAAVAKQGEEELGRRAAKGSKSKTVLEILAAQCDHYGYLRNHSARRATFSKAQLQEV